MNRSIVYDKEVVRFEKTSCDGIVYCSPVYIAISDSLVNFKVDRVGRRVDSTEANGVVCIAKIRRDVAARYFASDWVSTCFF